MVRKFQYDDQVKEEIYCYICGKRIRKKSQLLYIGKGLYRHRYCLSPWKALKLLEKRRKNE